MKETVCEATRKLFFSWCSYKTELAFEQLKLEGRVKTKSSRKMNRENNLCIILSLLALLMHDSAATAAEAPAFTILSSCQSHCGEIAIPYPFGIGYRCYLNNWYEIICKNDSGKFVPFLRSIDMDVVNISLPDMRYGYSPGGGSVHIKSRITSSGCSSEEEVTSPLNVTGSPFFLADSNKLLAVGCNNKALMTEVKPQIAGCESTCDARNNNRGQNKSCDGYRCCEASIPAYRNQQIIGIKIESVSNNTAGGGCSVAFLTDESYSLSNISEPQHFHHKGYAIVELGWYFDTSNLQVVDPLGCVNVSDDSVSSYGSMDSCICEYGYLPSLSYRSCGCNSGYRGSPYTPGGCIDIDECQELKDEGRNPCEKDICENIPGNYSCKVRKTSPIVLGFSLGFGLLVLVIGSWWLYKFVRKRKKINRRKKFFKRNGGLLLQHQLTAAEGNIEKTKIFSSKELEKATEKFSENRILGQGGQGTVYKGMLVDGRIVAVKKSKVVDHDNLEEFINEVVILSQINHRNVVKLLGCCLETEVPILVYEFIPNGNLFEHLHDQCDDYKMTWKARLHIAIEVSGALSYLHSAASAPVYHRDIKSTNILLDEKYRAKVSDFGTSRSVTIDHTHLTTIVLGTAGYVDPEYLQSSQFTDKSDVYSFGVVLVELITGEKPLSFLRPQESRTLATHFILAMKENRFFDIIDLRIKDDCVLEEVMAVAILANRCLNLNGKKRPSMREVAIELERIRASPKDLKFQTQHEEEEDDEGKEINIGNFWNIALTASASEKALASSSDAEPLVPYQTW